MERGLTVFKDLIIGDRIFQVPIYQRNYSWEETQWDDLWNDLLYLRSDRRHYFGTLLLKLTQERRKSGLKSFEVYEVIDGQQRTATVLILLKEIISQLQKLEDEDIMEEIARLREDYLIYKGVYKIELLGDDKEFFRKSIIEDIEYPDEILTPSQRRLREAKSFFGKKIEELKGTLSPVAFKDVLLELKQKVDNMEIIRYEVENTADAVLIFETVNDRGKILTNMEKTKSFIMHAIYLSAPEEPSDYLSQVNNSFANMFRWFEVIKNTKQGENISEDDIQRYHFIVYEANVVNRRETSYQYMRFLRGKIRGMYRSKPSKCLDYALDYTKDLESAFFTLKEITTFNEKNKTGDLLTRVFTLERVANFFPLLIASWIRFKKETGKLEGILSKIEDIVFRIYAIGRRRADTGEGWLYDLAYRVHKEKLGYDEIIDELSELIDYYEDDKDFGRDLRVENFYARVATRDTKYLLFEYERFLREQSREPLDIGLEDILQPTFEIEHIWAHDPSKLGLSEELLEVHEQYRDKLGNLTVASKSWNAQWGNQPFSFKRKSYRKSILRVQKELSDLRKWGRKQIDEREDKIIEFALTQWGV